MGRLRPPRRSFVGMGGGEVESVCLLACGWAGCERRSGALIDGLPCYWVAARCVY